MNIGILFIIIFQVSLCILAAILKGYYYYHDHLDDVDPNGFGYTKYRFIIECVLNFFTYLLLLSSLIPETLIITIEKVHLIQGYFMKNDRYSYSHFRHKFLKTNSVSLNEECGLVKYIFTDKTGTLTCNKMNFKYCVIGDVCYQYLRDASDETKKEEQEFSEQKFREKENIIPFEKYDMYKATLGSKPKLSFS